MKKLYYSIFFLSCLVSAQDLVLKGIIDFTVPEGGSNGKALHLQAVNAIADLSLYGIGIANNGGGTDGVEFTFPAISANAGDHIFLPRSIAAMTAYFESLNHFQIVIEDGIATQNGDDAVELFFNGEVIEIFGDIDCQPATADDCPGFPNYEDAWAYKETDTWVFADAQCTDDSTTSASSNCPYPFLDTTLSNDDFNTQQFSLYPNPSSNGSVFINTNFIGEKNIQILDMNGRVVLNTKTLSNAINIQELKSGFYLVQMSIDNQNFVSKLAVK